MDRVQEIIHLENMANLPEARASSIKWEAARLIWEELQGPGAKTQSQLAREIGRTQAHVSYMAKCWRIVGSVCEGKLPTFNTIYNSDEIRKSDRTREQEAGQKVTGTGTGTGTGGRHRKDSREGDREEDQFSPSALVGRAQAAISILARNPAYWPLLSRDDWAGLTQILADIGTVRKGDRR